MSTENSDINYIYNSLKVLLSGCKHISDAYEISELFINEYPAHKKLIKSIIHGKVYENTMSIKNIHGTITDISLLTYKEDVIDLIDNICDGRSISEPQKRSFLRLGKMKIIKPFSCHNDEKKQDKIELEKKKCPHCGHICIAQEGTEYIVCGYSDPQKGFDFQGCGRDWCFKCGKILCKIWEQDSLFLEMNRHHNGECCVNHAKKNGKNYTLDYCQCINHHVNRNNIAYDFGLEVTV